MIAEVPDTVMWPDVEDLTVAVGGFVRFRSDRPHEHPIAWQPFIGIIATGMEGGIVWACHLTGNGGRVDTLPEALEALLSEALTEYPTTDRRTA